MTLVTSPWDWKFDDVQLGIDVKFWRLARGKSQEQIANMLPNRPTKNWVAALERGAQTEGIPMNKFIALCRIMDCDPRQYFVIEKSLL